MQVLLLNSTFIPLSFVSERRAINLLLKERVEPISDWEGVRYYYGSGFINLPAIIRMNYFVARKFKKILFSRGAVFRRDEYCCQYCGIALTPNTITLDHIIPKSLGGENSFFNCVSSCGPCNRRKGILPLEKSGLQLIKLPEEPNKYTFFVPESSQWHPTWKSFLL